MTNIYLPIPTQFHHPPPHPPSHPPVPLLNLRDQKMRDIGFCIIVNKRAFNDFRERSV